MLIQENRYYIDGADLWTHYGVGVESGSDDFLKMPKRKDSITHDWMDEHGLDVDTSRVFLKDKEIDLKCHIIANSESDFWEKYNRLLTALTLPGERRMSVTELGRDFFVIYKECTNFTRFTRIKGTSKVACKFVLKLQQTLPAMTEQTFIIDEANRFIIT